ncbi:MAG: ribosome silencing factor [Flavobacteriales bacterium]|nr:ribosome silencing factor [Flavobacteriales bacterium]
MAKKIKLKNPLIEFAIHGIREKKGKEIHLLDLSDIPTAVCKYFLICNGDSTTQVQALADSIIEEVRKATGEKPWHTEGYDNKEWILIDYADLVVHVFLPEVRDFYGLEDLWADAKSELISEEA